MTHSVTSMQVTWFSCSSVRLAGKQAEKKKTKDKPRRHSWQCVPYLSFVCWLETALEIRALQPLAGWLAVPSPAGLVGGQCLWKAGSKYGLWCLASPRTPSGRRLAGSCHHHYGVPPKSLQSPAAPVAWARSRRGARVLSPDELGNISLARQSSQASACLCTSLSSLSALW